MLMVKRLFSKDENISKPKLVKNSIKQLLTTPYNLISLISIVFLLYLIAVPLLEIVRTTFQVQPQDIKIIKDAQPGEFTLYYWIRILKSNISKSLFYKPLVNSLLISSFVSIFAIALGGGMAWLMVRTDLPYKKFFGFAVILPYMMPSWYKAMAWLEVFRNERIGGHKGFIAAMFGVQPPDWLAYGFVPIVITLTIHYYAYAYLLISSALSTINSELEEMGEIVGASRWKILKKITFPLVLPAVFSSFILTFSKAIGTFGTPAFLGLKVNYYTLATMLYSSVKNRQTVQAYVMSIVLIIISVIIVYINQRAIGNRKSYATIGGKGGRDNIVALGKWKPLILTLLIGFIVVAVIFPILILVVQSFMLRGGEYSLSNFTLHYWIGKSNPAIGDGEVGLLRNPIIWKSAWNTLKLVIVSSLLATVCGLIIGYIVSRGRSRLSGRFIEQLSFAPYLIPSISFGAIYLSMFSKGRLGLPALYGTLTLLILISVVKYLPFACRAGTSNMLQISTELEEAAAIEGTSFIRRFISIIMPLAKSGFLSGFLLIFISAMKELDLIVLLVTPSNTTLVNLTYAYAETGFQQYSNALVVIIMTIVVGVYLISNKLGNADISKGIGG